MRDAESAASEPIATAEQDALGRADFARRIAQTLVTADGKRARKLVLGLVGPWGSGKTSVLNLVEQALGRREPRPAVVRFNPWVVSGRDDLLRHLLIDIAAKLDPDNPKAGAKRFLKTAKPYLNALSVAADVHVPGAGGVMRRAVGAAQAALTATPPLAELKAAVEHALRGAGRPVIVFIDDIDRLTDAEVRVIAQIVRAVADFDNVAYLLAYDQQRVEEALGADALGGIGEKREYGRRYLEKLVNLALRLPLASHHDMTAFLQARVEAVLKDTGLFTQSGHPADVLELIRHLVRNVLIMPRDQLRAADVFGAYAGMVDGEVDAADLLAFAALEVRFPHLADFIRSVPHWLHETNRDSDDYMIQVARLGQFVDEPARWQFLFPGQEGGIPDAAKGVIAWLFPGLAGREAGNLMPRPGPPRWNGLERPGRLYALLRATGIVLPVPNRRIRECICGDEDAAFKVIMDEHAAGRLATFFDAIRQPAAEVPEARPDWLLGMARFLSEVPWRDQGLGRNRIAPFGQIVQAMLRAGERHRDGIKQVMQQLLERGDIHLLPAVLYQHAWAYGLLLYNTEREDRLTCLDHRETESMLNQWCAAQPGQQGWDGWLCRISSDLPIILLRDTGHWTDPAKHALEGASSEPNADDWVAAIFGDWDLRGDLKTLLP